MTSRANTLRGFALRAGAGTAFAVFLLAMVEVVLRVVLGAPDVPLVRSMPDLDPLFVVTDGRVDPVFQDIDTIGTFAEHPGHAPRVVFAGASSVRGGSGLAPEHEFPGRVGASLGSRVEALNLGRPALDSADVLAVVRGALAFDPQVVVVYLGHNDVGNLGMRARFSGGWASTAARVDATLSRLQLYASAKGLLRRPRPLTASTLTIHEDDRAAAVAAFTANLTDLVTAVRHAGATPILLTPLSNLRANPGAATCPDRLPSGALLSEAGRWRLHTDLATVDAALAEAPDCPDLLWARGILADDLASLRRAAALDPVPMRAPTAIVEAIRAVARQTDSPLVDLAARFDPPDPAWFVDPVHLSAAGHETVARVVAPAVESAL